MKIKQYPSVTGTQMEALKRFISVSKDISDFGKKAVIYLLNQSENLSLPVRMSMPGKIGREVQNGVHAMCSANCRTQIGFFFDGMGTQMHLCHHGGLFDENGEFNPGLDGSTIWVSVDWYDKNSKTIKFNKAKISRIRLFDCRDL